MLLHVEASHAGAARGDETCFCGVAVRGAEDVQAKDLSTAVIPSHEAWNALGVARLVLLLIVPT